MSWISSIARYYRRIITVTVRPFVIIIVYYAIMQQYNRTS